MSGPHEARRTDGPFRDSFSCRHAQVVPARVVDSWCGHSGRPVDWLGKRPLGEQVRLKPKRLAVNTRLVPR